MTKKAQMLAFAAILIVVVLIGGLFLLSPGSSITGYFVKNKDVKISLFQETYKQSDLLDGTILLKAGEYENTINMYIDNKLVKEIEMISFLNSVKTSFTVNNGKIELNEETNYPIYGNQISAGEVGKHTLDVKIGSKTDSASYVVE